MLVRSSLALLILGHVHCFTLGSSQAVTRVSSSVSNISPASVLQTRLMRGGSSLNVAVEPPLSETKSRLQDKFESAIDKSLFVGYLTAGYPNPNETVDLLLALQAGGTDVIELGIPFTDPQADGTTIQRANEVALTFDVTLDQSIKMVEAARAKGLTVPVVLMGYYNPFLAYGLDRLMEACKSSGVDGFIVVDLPAEEGNMFVKKASTAGLSYIPLVSPTTTNERIKYLSGNAGSFIYCVSVTGVTGARGALPDDLKDFIARVRENSNVPLAVGFGISNPEQVQEVAELAEGVVVGSAIINTIDAAADKTPAERATALKEYIASVTKSMKPIGKRSTTFTAIAPEERNIDSRSFGAYGGRYIPETLEDAHKDLEAAYAEANADPEFHKLLAYYRREFTGGPTPLYLAKNLSKKVGGANIWVKREELAHTGAHKINNAIGQALLAKRLGKKRIIAETGAGQHGVATAAVCAQLGLELVVYMGAVDCERQALNVLRMNVLGATVVPVESGSKTLKDAINEAMRDWVTNVRTTHYIIGSAVGPHPFPTIVRDFQTVIGKEARAQMLEKAGKLPDVIVACVGGGSNAMGIFHPFREDKDVRLIGCEAGGEGPGGLHSATLTLGKPGVLHGSMTYLLQDEAGQITKTKSISAGLDYPGVGPEHAFLKDSGRAEYVAVTDAEAMDAFFELSKCEGIIPALESSHAFAHAMKVAKELGEGKDILVNLSGRGDKDMMTVAKYMGKKI